MKVNELEDKVWRQDGVRVIVRAPANARVGDYAYRNAAQKKWSVTNFIKNRLTPVLRGNDVVVLMGDGEEPHGRTLLDSVRASYRK